MYYIQLPRTNEVSPIMVALFFDFYLGKAIFRKFIKRESSFYVRFFIKIFTMTNLCLVQNWTVRKKLHRNYHLLKWQISMQFSL